MKAKQKQQKIKDVVELKKQGMISANPEYQRGIVWSLAQQKKLIDSILRGYPLPLIYFHHIKREVAGMSREDLEIIDGQQRISAIHGFIEGAFSLFDPKRDAAKAKFPTFIQEQPCSWAGKEFSQLSEIDKRSLLERELTVAMIETNNPNEVRDLFVRLQSGLALNQQETRDALPGDFTDFILKIGGKPDVLRYPGHEFFRKPLGMKPGQDRGKTRQLAAQIAMLLITRRRKGPGFACDINASSINDFYYSNLDFSGDCEDATRVRRVLDVGLELLVGAKLPKLRAHDAIHLVLLIDSMLDDYAPIWKEKVIPALGKFMAELAKSKSSNGGGEYWLEYGQWTRVNSDRSETIARRHRFYIEKMFEFMGGLEQKDKSRMFGEVERTLLYFRQNQRCAVCNGMTEWNDSEVHHVQPHHQGGKTVLENGALVHKLCHPKSAKDVAEFALKHATKSSF